MFVREWTNPIQRAQGGKVAVSVQRITASLSGLEWDQGLLYNGIHDKARINSRTSQEPIRAGA